MTEQKFEGGTLSEGQQEAMNLLGDRFRLDRFLARDLGAGAGLAVANGASDIARAYDKQARNRSQNWDW